MYLSSAILIPLSSSVPPGGLLFATSRGLCVNSTVYLCQCTNIHTQRGMYWTETCTEQKVCLCLFPLFERKRKNYIIHSIYIQYIPIGRRTAWAYNQITTTAKEQRFPLKCCFLASARSTRKQDLKTVVDKMLL